MWSALVAVTLLVPVGMGPDELPQRYICRLPGLKWLGEHQIVEYPRGEGVPLSTGSLPGQRFVPRDARVLPGAERLSREVVQFRVDDQTGEDDIVRRASRIQKVIFRTRNRGSA